jgi:hypothetical protein
MRFPADAGPNTLADLLKDDQARRAGEHPAMPVESS